MAIRKNWMGTLLLVVLMMGTGWFFLNSMSIPQLIDTLSVLRLEYLVLGLGLVFVYVGCEGMGSRQILGTLGYQIPLKRCIGYSFVGFYVSSITPSSSGGQPAQVYCMTKDGVSAAHGTLNMMLLSICYQMTTLLYGIVAWFTMPQFRVAMDGGLGILLLYGGGTMALLSLLMGIVMFLPRVARCICFAVLRLLLKVGIVKKKAEVTLRLEHQLEIYKQGAICIRSHPALMLKVALLMMVQMAAIYSVPYMVYLAFGLQGHGIIEVVLLQALIALAVSNLPLPGTVGAAEMVFVSTFTIFFGSELVTPAMLVSRGISFYFFLLISGCVTLGIHIHLRKRQRKVSLQELRRQSSGSVDAVERYLENRAQR